MNRSFTLLLFAFVAVSCLVVVAADWPQWRGPHRDGVSSETGLLKEWPEGGPKLIWQVQDVGDGYSTPAVVGERIYLLGSKGMDDESVYCLSAGDGKTLWKSRLGNVGPNQNALYPGARSTPTVDGNRLYAMSSDGDLACLETSSGKTVWHKNVRQEFGGKTGWWAYAESPLIDGDVLVCTPGGADAAIVALKKSTGELIWKYASPAPGEEAGYSSAIVVQTEGVKQYVQLLNKGLVGLDAKTGHELWRYTGIIKDFPNIPTPVSAKDIVYGATAKGGGGFVRLKRTGSGVEAAEVYAGAKLPTAIGGSVEVNGYLYGTSSGALMCVEVPSGEVKWQAKGVGVGSLLYADGRLYVHAENVPGEVALVEATPEEYRERGRFTPPNGPHNRLVDVNNIDQNAKAKKVSEGRTWAYPVIANGRLYIRDWNCLWCYDVKAK